MIATTIEQSKHLFELGLDPKTADMAYICGAPESLNVVDDYYLKDIHDEYDTPAWSLSALLEVMPTTIEIDGLRYDLELFKAIDDDTDSPYYGVKYVYNDDYHLDYYESGSNIIEQAFAMVCILLENGYIKKGGVRYDTAADHQ